MIAPSARMMPWASLRNVAARLARARAVEHPLRGESHDARVPVVRLHELLDTERHAVHEAELMRDVFLVAEREAVLLTACAQVQAGCARATSISRADFELANFPGQERARPDVVLFVSRAPSRSRGPLRDVHVAQAPSALFHVGFQQVEAPAETAVTGRGVLFERVEELHADAARRLAPAHRVRGRPDKEPLPAIRRKSMSVVVVRMSSRASS